MRKALITGIRGQDGSYLSEFLLNKDYEVHGVVRRGELEKIADNPGNLEGFLERIKLHEADLNDYSESSRIISLVNPEEVYHLAAQSFVFITSSEEAKDTLRSNVESTLFLIEAIKKFKNDCRFYFAGSSEMFGNVVDSPQNEETSFRPRNAYGISKVAGYHFMRTARESGLFGCAGLTFNHESPRRKETFITRKISSAVGRIANGSREKLKVGDLEARRDWGYAPEYIKAMWLMLQQDKPDDYVISSGESHSVRDFLDRAFGTAGLNWEDYVETDKTLLRPNDKSLLIGNSSKARVVLGWKPRVSFEGLVEIMVKEDIRKGKVSE